ncbi:MAG: hypothetical protein HQ514_11775, partial [Rhodospirillales bacterium]|nr:hypothetical protein [Rhodospirillales bacterium]
MDKTVLDLFQIFMHILAMQEHEIPPTPTKGRGAISNLMGRFEAHTRHVIDDGWPRDEEPDRLKTTATIDAARTI